MMNENETMHVKFDLNACISSCEKGDLIETVRGEKFIFQSVARVNFVGKNLKNGKLYNIKISVFGKILQKGYEKDETDVKGWMDELKKDDMFYIVNKSKCILFKFVRHTPSGILALNPYDDMPTRISSGFPGKKL